MLLEPALQAPALVRLGDKDDADLFQHRWFRRGGRTGRRFLLCQAAQGRKFRGGGSATSARALFFRPPSTFMHSR